MINIKRAVKFKLFLKLPYKKKDFNLLSQIQDYFGVGKITKHGNTTLQYTVKSLKDIGLITDHLDKYPLLSLKIGDYKLFSESVLLLKNKKHLTK